MGRVADGMCKQYGPLPYARTAYKNKRKDAMERNIPFELSFKDYYEWFLLNGVDKNKKQQIHKDMLCMCRFNDTGPYSLDNIYIDTMSNNSTFRNYNYNYSKRKK